MSNDTGFYALVDPDHQIDPLGSSTYPYLVSIWTPTGRWAVAVRNYLTDDRDGTKQFRGYNGEGDIVVQFNTETMPYVVAARSIVNRKSDEEMFEDALEDASTQRHRQNRIDALNREANHE